MDQNIDRLIAVGDIHGHLGKLCDLMSQIQPTKHDQLVFLGDYIDRGPESAGVIDYLIGLRGKFPSTVFLRGNHEQLFLDAMVCKGVRQGPTLREQSVFFGQQTIGSDMNLFLGNGGGDTMKNYDWSWEKIPPSHISFFENTALWWRYDKFLFVHAGCCLSEVPDALDPWVLLWSRDCDPGEGGDVHVVGHTPLSSGYPSFAPGLYMLDTGCAYNGPLSACDVLNKEVWQSIH